MDTTQKWLQTHQQRLACDFAGIACNVATDDKPKEIRWIYVAGNQSEAYKKIRLQIGRGIAGLVWKTARTQLDENILEQPEKLIDYPIAGNQSEAYKKIRLQIGRGIAGLVWKTARTQLDENILEQPEKLIDYPIARLEKLQVALAAPVIKRKEVVAVLLLGYRQNHQFTRTEKEQLEKLTSELSELFAEDQDD